MKYRKRFLVFVVVLAFVALFTGGVWAKSAEKKADAPQKASVSQVNINKATAEELTQLDGIGDKIAERIVKYREKNGKFEKKEDLMNVKGIGQATFDKNKDKIVLK